MDEIESLSNNFYPLTLKRVICEYLLEISPPFILESMGFRFTTDFIPFYEVNYTLSARL
jgi:hypothetical protein